MLANSGERWLVADHMKLDRCEPHHVADLAQIQRLFTDRPWDNLDEQSLIELCRRRRPQRRTLMNDTARPLQVALIGYGFVGKAFHAPLINAVPGLELSVAASRDAAKVHADLPHAQVIADPLEAIRRPEVDLVVIASPNDTHALALAALEAGKHVVVDKPFTLDLAQARTLITAAKTRSPAVGVPEPPLGQRLPGREAGDRTGLIGKVTHFESHIDRYRPEVRVRWREQNLPGSGLWFDLGPHMVDQALQLFGLPHSVQANIATLRPNAQVNDWAHVVLNYPTHRVILHGSMLVAGRGALYRTRRERQRGQSAPTGRRANCWPA